MTRHLTAVVTAGALTTAALLGGCDQGLSDAELAAASERARATVTDVADDLLETLRDSNPDLEFVREADSGGPARSWDCSDDPAASGGAIQWGAYRTVQVEPTGPTVHLIDPLIADLEAEGWTLTDERDVLDARVYTLWRDAYHVELAGERGPFEDDPARVVINVFTPCLPAPTS
jgi:hypothetical protein